MLILILSIGAKAEDISVSTVAFPTSGDIPLKVQFTAAATGLAPISYSWDFDDDNVIDSTQQNPLYTYSIAGEYNATLTVIDSNNLNATAIIPITAISYDSHLNLVSCFPSTLVSGENQIVCIIENEGAKPINDIVAKIVGVGIQHMTSTSIPTLNPEEQDSLTIKVNVLQTGAITSTLRIMEKKFPLTFEVTQKQQYSEEEIQANFDKLKEEFNKQQTIYYQKKAEGYPVAEVLDSIKQIEAQFRTAQQQLITNNLQEAKITLEMIAPALTDLTSQLQNVQKPKVTLLMWMKDNALAITAIIAAVGTLAGIIAKLFSHAKDVKEKAQKRFSFKKENKTEEQPKS